MDRGAWYSTAQRVTIVGHNLVTKPPPPLGKWLCWCSHTSTHAQWLLFRHGQDWGWGGKTRSRDGIGSSYYAGVWHPLWFSFQILCSVLRRYYLICKIFCVRVKNIFMQFKKLLSIYSYYKILTIFPRLYDVSLSQSFVLVPPKFFFYYIC